VANNAGVLVVLLVVMVVLVDGADDEGTPGSEGEEPAVAIEEGLVLLLLAAPLSSSISKILGISVNFPLSLCSQYPPL